MNSSITESFLKEVNEILLTTAPDFDLSAVAAKGQSLGLLSTSEAEKLSLYTQFPSWIESYLGTIAKNIESYACVNSCLVTSSIGRLSPPLGKYIDNSILASFKGGNISSPDIIRTTGGPSVHYVANFRQLSWGDEGCISGLCDSNARVLLPYFKSAEPVHLKGKTFLSVVEGSSVYTHWLLDT